MQFGINFNGKPIPEHIRAKFPQTVKGDTGRLRIQGVASTTSDMAAMRVQADNGRREIVTRTKKVGEDWWFGIYAP